jgi:putative flippase GtrA
MTSDPKSSLLSKDVIRQGGRYLIIGFSSFALEFLLFALLLEVFAVFVVISNVVAITAASLFNFSMSRKWTFKVSSRLARSIILYLILFAWNQLFSSVAILWLMDVDVAPFIAKVFTMAAIVCWNFVLYRKVVFK